MIRQYKRISEEKTKLGADHRKNTKICKKCKCKFLDESDELVCPECREA